MSNISILIICFNEEKHIERCILSALKLTPKVYVIDSFSTDATVDIAIKLGAVVLQNSWTDHATQINWALNNCEFDTEWIMRLDADEIITQQLADELIYKLPNIDNNIGGMNVKRRVFFMGKWIKYGGYYPVWLLRIWRNGKAICEQRIMDEHMKLLDGNTLSLQNDIIDDNKNSLSWWTNKHNNYATKEAFELFNHIYNFQLSNDLVTPRLFGSQAERKRWLKYNYAKLPLFFRPFIYFIYRYIFLLGFLDGRKGLIWHFLQGFWYRFLVDAKMYDIYRLAGKNKSNVLSCLTKVYDVKL